VERWLAEVGVAGEGHEDESLMWAKGLQGFCQYTGNDPDALLESCFRKTKQGDMAISAKGRREIDAQIDEYEASLGLAGRDAIVAGNRIRSFLIHNGVFMQGRVAYP
jgi:hypothetical protein